MTPTAGWRRRRRRDVGVDLLAASVTTRSSPPSPSNLFDRVAEVHPHPVVAVDPLEHAADLRPEHPIQGGLEDLHDRDVAAEFRSDAATSAPMNPMPTHTARAPSVAASRICSASPAIREGRTRPARPAPGHLAASVAAAGAHDGRSNGSARRPRAPPRARPRRAARPASRSALDLVLRVPRRPAGPRRPRVAAPRAGTPSRAAAARTEASSSAPIRPAGPSYPSPAGLPRRSRRRGSPRR